MASNKVGKHRRKSKRYRRNSHRRKRAGTFLQTLRSTVGIGPESYDNRACNTKLGQTINIAKTGVACEDYYMGSPGSSNAKFLAPGGTCNNLLYTKADEDYLGQKQPVRFCRKGVNKTGQCQTVSPTRKQLGTCNNKDMSDLLSSLKVNTNTALRANHKNLVAQSRAFTSQFPSVPTQDDDIARRLKKLQEGGKARKAKRTRRRSKKYSAKTRRRR
jgi:hypothetical protein